LTRSFGMTGRSWGGFDCRTARSWHRGRCAACARTGASWCHVSQPAIRRRRTASNRWGSLSAPFPERGRGTSTVPARRLSVEKVGTARLRPSRPMNRADQDLRSGAKPAGTTPSGSPEANTSPGSSASFPIHATTLHRRIAFYVQARHDGVSSATQRIFVPSSYRCSSPSPAKQSPPNFGPRKRPASGRFCALGLGVRRPERYGKSLS
jgi:hypothetical protein